MHYKYIRQEYFLRSIDILILYLLQSFFSDFNGDDKGDALCVPESGRRSLALGDAAGTFLVFFDCLNTLKKLKLVFC